MGKLADLIREERIRVTEVFLKEQLGLAASSFDYKVSEKFGRNLDEIRKKVLGDSVYFVEMNFQGLPVIKIGRSHSVGKRLDSIGGSEFSQLEGHWQKKKHLLCIIQPKCSISDLESALHVGFRDYRVYQREYFDFDAVMSFLVQYANVPRVNMEAK